MRGGEGAEALDAQEEGRGSEDLMVHGRPWVGGRLVLGPGSSYCDGKRNIKLSLIQCLTGVTSIDCIILSVSNPVRQVLYLHFIKKEMDSEGVSALPRVTQQGVLWDRGPLPGLFALQSWPRGGYM